VPTVIDPAPFGVHGQTLEFGGAGVVGETTSGYPGVQGSSAGGPGVQGSSTTGVGVTGTSAKAEATPCTALLPSTSRLRVR
jgi:hypothetical protein